MDNVWVALIPIGVVLISLLGGFATWFLNEWSKRRAEEYLRKEARYGELVSRIRAFSVDSGDKHRRSEFLDNLNLAWLYCSDDVIEKAYAFLDSVHVDATEVGAAHDERKAKLLGELMLAIRKDMLERRPLAGTKLSARSFRLLGAK